MLQAGVGELGWRVGELDGWAPAAVALLDRHQLVDSAKGALAVRGDEPRAHAVHQAGQDRVGVRAVARRLLQHLGLDLPDHQLVEVAGEHDGCLGEAGLVEQYGRLDGEIGQVARIEADADRRVALRPQLLEHADRVWHTALQRIHRVYKQQTVVGVDLGVGAEGVELALAKGEEDLDHCVGVGAPGRQAERAGEADVRAEVGAADQGRARAGVGAALLAAPQAKLQHGVATAHLADAGGLGGDQGLVVELVEQGRLQDLGHGQGAAHYAEGDVGVNDAALGDGAQADRLEAAVLAQIGEKIVGEDLAASVVALGAQVGQILVAEAGLAHPVEQPLQPGAHAVASLVQAVVRVATEEVVELGGALVEAGAEVELGHAQLVLIGKEDALGCALVVGLHGVSQMFSLQVAGGSFQVFSSQNQFAGDN